MRQLKQGSPTKPSPLDIEDRLKGLAYNWNTYFNHGAQSVPPLLNEAADEIAKLRMAVAMLENEIETIVCELKERT